MSYVSVEEGAKYRVIEILKIPRDCDINFVLELRDSMLRDDERKIVYIKFSGDDSLYPRRSLIECKTFHDNLRRILIRSLFEDSYYVGLLDRPIRDIEVEILLALDYIKYLDDVDIGFTSGYLPLSSGTIYSIFKGGISLLNILYRFPRVSELISRGFVIGEQVDLLEYTIPFDVEVGLKLKKLYRELFLRLTQFIGEIESNMHFRF